MIEHPPGRRHRPLRDSERVLWSEVTRGIVPLRPRPDTEAKHSLSETEAMPAKPAAPPPHTMARPARPSVPPPASPPLAPLGRRVRQRLARRGDIAGRVDLHGLTQREAHDVLLGFLRSAQERGGGIVLVITGKGGGFAGEGERGVLRRQVPHWLRLPQFRSVIVGFETAHAAHGGEGALYVQIRRRRD